MFRPANRTVVTLAPDVAQDPRVKTVVLPSDRSPFVSIRLLFAAGSADDPPVGRGWPR